VDDRNGASAMDLMMTSFFNPYLLAHNLLFDNDLSPNESVRVGSCEFDGSDRITATLAASSSPPTQRVPSPQIKLRPNEEWRKRDWNAEHRHFYDRLRRDDELNDMFLQFRREFIAEATSAAVTLVDEMTLSPSSPRLIQPLETTEEIQATTTGAYWLFYEYGGLLLRVAASLTHEDTEIAMKLAKHGKTHFVVSSF